MKKFFALLLSTVMVLSMSMTAFADDPTIKISVPSDDSHEYEVYQIFTGDLSEGVLSNVKWGANGIKEEGTAVDSDILKELAGTTGTNQEKLEVIKKYVDLDTDAFKVVNNTTPYNPAAPGYYLIKDTSIAAGTDDAYTTYIVKVVGDVEIARKAAKPTVDKQVQDEVADAETGADANGWGETADHAINETFQFKLTATLPDDKDLADYKSYQMIFTDTMSAGVTFESIESVTVGNVTLQSADYKCTATPGQAGGSWTLTIEDLLKVNGITDLKNLTVEVIYNAHLNKDAVMADAENNRNTVSLQYSNNPNVGGEGDFGKTPEDTVFVFTYKVPNFKYILDDDKNPIAKEGAGFRLFKEDGTTEIGLIKDGDHYRPIADGETAVEMFSDATGHFDIHGLDIGTYILRETTTPAGFNTAADTKFVIGTSEKHVENGEGTNATVTHTLKLDGSDVHQDQIEILNSKGTELPETGGVGTTIFYVVGGIMMMCAVVLLITKKKMSVSED